MSTKRGASMPAGEFKAKCLAVLDEVAATHRTVVITKRGHPVAKLVPMDAEDERAPLEGLIVKQGDLVSPLGEPWDADEE